MGIECGKSCASQSEIRSFCCPKLRVPRQSLSSIDYNVPSAATGFLRLPMVPNLHFQLATERDLLRFVELMREFYQSQGMVFDEEIARSSLKRTLLDSTLGSAYLVLLDEQLVGYFVLTFCFSLEFHGKFALLDEIYILEVFRKQKLGSAIVEFVEGVCRKMGIKALRLEVGQENQAAQSLYRTMGFKQDLRYLFTKWL